MILGKLIKVYRRQHIRVTEVKDTSVAKLTTTWIRNMPQKGSRLRLESSGSWRTIIDLSPHNWYVPQSHFKMCHVHQAHGLLLSHPNPPHPNFVSCGKVRPSSCWCFCFITALTRSLVFSCWSQLKPINTASGSIGTWTTGSLRVSPDNMCNRVHPLQVRQSGSGCQP